MKLYVVQLWGGDGSSQIVGVFSTGEAAAFVAGQQEHADLAEFTLDEVADYMRDDVPR